MCHVKSLLLQIYEAALESQAEFNGFVDFCDTFHILAGDGMDDDEGQEVIGEFKVRLNIILLLYFACYVYVAIKLWHKKPWRYAANWHNTLLLA